MTPDSEILRGFGMVFGVGGVRNWCVGAVFVLGTTYGDMP